MTMSPRSGIWMLLIALAIGELAFLLAQPDANPALIVAYRIWHLLQMIGLMAWVVHIQRNGQNHRLTTLILLGLGLSLMGDLVNSRLVDLGQVVDPQTLLSVPPFALAHFCYIAVFWHIAKPRRNTLLLSALIWLPIAVGLWAFIIDDESGPLIQRLSFGYALIVAGMAVASTWTRHWLLMVGGWLFLCSDALIGAWLTAPVRPAVVDQLIWTTYFLAQCLLAQAVFVRPADQPATAGQETV